MGRKFRSESERRRYVREYEELKGKVSKSQYCRERGLASSSFAKWYDKFSSKESGKFIKVTPDPASRTFYVKVFGLRLIKLELSV